MRVSEGDEGGLRRRYATGEAYTVAAVEYRRLEPDQDAVGVVERELESAARFPTFDVLSWDLRPGSGLLFATFRRATGPVNTDFICTVVANQETGNVWIVSAPDEEAITVLGSPLPG